VASNTGEDFKVNLSIILPLTRGIMKYHEVQVFHWCFILILSLLFSTHVYILIVTRKQYIINIYHQSADCFSQNFIFHYFIEKARGCMTERKGWGTLFEAKDMCHRIFYKIFFKLYLISIFGKITIMNINFKNIFVEINYQH
jgi:hypothetical protein